MAEGDIDLSRRAGRPAPHDPTAPDAASAAFADGRALHAIQILERRCADLEQLVDVLLCTTFTDRVEFSRLDIVLARDFVAKRAKAVRRG